MPDRQYFLCEFRLDGQRLIVIWYNDSTDGLVVNDKGRLVSFENIESALNYADSRSFKIEDQAPAIYEFDAIQNWAQSSVAMQFSCVELLDAWNMLHDVVVSVEHHSRFQAIDSEMNGTYKKLFYGTNILCPPEAEQYEPTWSRSEIQGLAKLIMEGIRGLRAAIFA